MASKILDKRRTTRLIKQIAAKYHGDKIPNPVTLDKESPQDAAKHWEIIEENGSIIWQREPREDSTRTERYKLDLKLYSFPDVEKGNVVLGHLWDENKEVRTKVSSDLNVLFWKQYKERGAKKWIVVEEDGYALWSKNENPEHARRYRIMVTRL